MEGLGIEKVAARAGVGKATIYRRWPGKEDLLLDAMAAMKTPLPEPRGESVRDDLVALLDAMTPTSPTRAGPGSSRCCSARAPVPPADVEYSRPVSSRAARCIRYVLRRGVVTGELRPDTDVEAALFMLSARCWPAASASRKASRQASPSGSWTNCCSA